MASACICIKTFTPIFDYKQLQEHAQNAKFAPKNPQKTDFYKSL